MTHYLIYTLEVSICLLLFFIVYSFFLRNETFHSLKRLYLLLSVFLSAVIPLLPVIGLPGEVTVGPVVSISNGPLLTIYHDSFERVIVNNAKPLLTEIHSNNNLEGFILKAIFSIYLLGGLILLVKLIIRIHRIRTLSRYNYVDFRDGIKTVRLNGDYPTFSFFKCVYLNCDNMSDAEQNQVFEHEKVHIKECHSLDILMIEILHIFLWYNPIVRVIKRALVKVHECQADSQLVRSSDVVVEAYKSLLLKQYLKPFNIDLVHPFNFSLIKYRIDMIGKSKSKWWAKLKLACFLPVILIALVAFSKVTVKDESAIPAESVTVSDQLDSLNLMMVYIPAGQFTFNRSDGPENIRSEVTVDAFWMKQSEVTNGEYFEYVEELRKDSSITTYKNSLPDLNKAPLKNYFSDPRYKFYPVVGISFNQAKKFCKWKTAFENKKLNAQGKPPVQNYRLPYEAEWIYASTGGEEPEKIMIPQIKPLSEIGSGDPNEFGLYDMFNNVSEWTNSKFDAVNYKKSIQINPTSSIDTIIVKGNNFKDSAKSQTILVRGDNSFEYVGFRYVRSSNVELKDKKE